MSSNQTGFCIRHDNTGKLAPGTVGVSALHRQWIGLSVQGDEATIEPLPFQPSYLESLDLEVSFMRRGLDMAEQFSAEDMTKVFLKAFPNLIVAEGELLVFDFHGVNLKALVKGLLVVELADAQRRGAPPQGYNGAGILMEKTDVTFIKAGDSNIKIKSSSKKYVFGRFNHGSPNLSFIHSEGHHQTRS